MPFEASAVAIRGAHSRATFSTSEVPSACDPKTSASGAGPHLDPAGADSKGDGHCFQRQKHCISIGILLIFSRCRHPTKSHCESGLVAAWMASTLASLICLRRGKPSPVAAPHDIGLRRCLGHQRPFHMQPGAL